MDRTRSRVNAFVLLVSAAAGLAVAYASTTRRPFPGAWAIVVFAMVGALFEITSTQRKSTGATGNISFLVDLSAPLLFGAFWAALVTAIRLSVSSIASRKPPIRAAFNVAQTTLAVVVASSVYHWMVPEFPPRIITDYASLPFNDVLKQLGAFLVAAATYFTVNAAAVTTVVGISAGKSFRAALRFRAFNFLGYDLLASLLSIVVAWVYVGSDRANGLARLVPLAIFILFILARHMYGKLNTLQILYDQLDHAHERLELALREQLEMMVKSIEARDPYTSGHSRRVAALSKAIATDLGFQGESLDEVENAALLHDVGKIHAEFAPLLQKEGRLTQDEWEVMKTHASKSAELVGLFSRFRGTVQAAVRSHHERWDGKGYPDGLVTEDIPLGARIIMISDTIDAMTTDRPYRKALPFERVVAELQKYRSLQFDPRLVDIAINSVTLRRLVSDKDFLAEQTRVDRPISKAKTRPALRSQSNFLDAIRTGATSGT